MQILRKHYVSILAVLVFLGVLASALGYFAGRHAQNTIKASLDAFNRNDTVGAVQLADQILTNNPNDVQALLMKATALAQQGSLQFREQEYGVQAITLAEQALLIDQNSDEAHRIIGYSNEIMQKYPKAHTAYAKALALNPRNALALFGDAHAYDLQGDLVNAEAGYRAALAIDPTLDQANMGLGRILTSQQRFADALAIYTYVQQYSQNVRTRAEAAYSAGVMHNALSDSVSARALMEEAVSIDPTYAMAWSGLGKVLFEASIDSSAGLTLSQRNQLVSDSILALQKAISINSNQSQAYLGLAQVLAAIGQTSQALTILNHMDDIISNDITLNVPGKQAMAATVSTTLSVITKVTR